MRTTQNWNVVPRKEARRIAKERGHRLGRFKGGPSSSLAVCQKDGCDVWVEVDGVTETRFVFSSDGPCKGSED